MTHGLVICAFLAACSPDKRLNLIYDNVSALDLYGTWTYSQTESHGKLAGLRPEIKLYPDGLCAIRDLPVNESFVKWLGSVVNGNAEWKVVKGLNQEAQLMIEMPNGTGVDFDVMKSRSGKLFLFHSLKQPDDPDCVVLRRNR
jgi:hypothetical protein